MDLHDTKDSKSEGDPSLSLAPPPPPPYTPSAPRCPSGHRYALGPTKPFPALTDPPCYDSDGSSPIFIGSAIFNSSVHPCKIGPRLVPPCRVPYGGSEVLHYGRYDLLPFSKDTMEWVPASLGRIPPRRVPINGGYEENGAHLYHAVATVHGTRVPGKTGIHLGGCHVAYDGVEHVVARGYHILCWK